MVDLSVVEDYKSHLAASKLRSKSDLESMRANHSVVS